MPPSRFALRSRSDQDHRVRSGMLARVREKPPNRPEPVHLELSDETFIAADRSVLAAIVADPGRWRGWWPDLRLEVLRERGLKGCQWRVTSGGTAEIYLEPWHDGTLLHLFLRLELAVGRSSPGALQRAARDRTLGWKRTVTRLKDELEAGRPPGLPVSGLPVPGPPVQGRSDPP
jgi:hypothetical protein